MKTSNSGPNKKIPKVASHERLENVKNTRRTLKILQEAANDKENFAGRSRICKNTKLAGEQDNQDPKPKRFADKAIQTRATQFTADDLTSEEEPSADYWRLLAEKRGDALQESFEENDRLKEQIVALEEEKRACNEMLVESRTLCDILQEMVNEPDVSTEIAEEATETA